MTPPRFLQLHHEDAAAIGAEIVTGLQRPQAMISPKFLYDALGSRLFDAITELPEYYPTRTEREIFRAHGAAMAEAAGTGRVLVDLGAGNGEKAASLFDRLRPSRYVAVDISVDYLRDVLVHLQQRYPDIEMTGLGMDFSAQLVLPPEIGPQPRLLFYPGSSIGNFSTTAAATFLAQAREAAQGGGLLIGVDLVKPRAVLEPAYDDPLQVTAAFNRNLLRRLNALIGSDARVEDFAHVAFYNEAESRIEMHLEALREVTLHWRGGERRFAQGERIHTENSCKYRVEGFEAMLLGAGFARVRHWSDPQGWFAVFLAQA
jgi:L-histidine Nalpha-methyltransferase